MSGTRASIANGGASFARGAAIVRGRDAIVRGRDGLAYLLAGSVECSQFSQTTLSRALSAILSLFSDDGVLLEDPALADPCAAPTQTPLMFAKLSELKLERHDSKLAIEPLKTEAKRN